MTKITRLIALALLASCCFGIFAQELTFRGVYQTSRDNDYPNGFYSEYVGWNSTLGKAIFIVQQGLYKMDMNGNTLSLPVKDPEVNKADFYSNGQFTDNDKALWANNFNLMYANSGAACVDGIITTVMSREELTDEGNRFVGPLPTGVIGGAPLLIAAAIVFFRFANPEAKV